MSPFPSLEPIASPITGVVIVQPKQVITTPIAAVTKQPLFDIPTLAKQLTLGLSTILMLLLLVDIVYVWHKKVVRVGGKPVAHLLFLFVMTGIVWFMSFGSIL